MRARLVLMLPLVFLKVWVLNALVAAAGSLVTGAFIFLFFYLLLKFLSLFTSSSWYHAKLDILKSMMLIGGLSTFSLCLLIGLVFALAETYEQFRRLQGRSDLPVAFRALLMLLVKNVVGSNAKSIAHSVDSTEEDSGHKQKNH